MKLVCGLGNPGARYANTRHNVGFLMNDRVAARLGALFSQTKYSAQLASGRHRQEPVLLLKPQTFMNRSGQSVAPAMNFYRLEPSDLLVIHDDADLPAGAIRLKQGGGNAGHKGLISIQEQLGSGDFVRLRFGIGRPENPHLDLADYVLAEFTADERRYYEDRFELAVDAILKWMDDGVNEAMNAYNGR